MSNRHRRALNTCVYCQIATRGYPSTRHCGALCIQIGVFAPRTAALPHHPLVIGQTRGCHARASTRDSASCTACGVHGARCRPGPSHYPGRGICAQGGASGPHAWQPPPALTFAPRDKEVLRPRPPPNQVAAHDASHSFDHIDRVRKNALALAVAEGIPDSHTRAVIELAALLHDVSVSVCARAGGRGAPAPAHGRAPSRVPSGSGGMCFMWRGPATPTPSLRGGTPAGVRLEVRQGRGRSGGGHHRCAAHTPCPPALGYCPAQMGPAARACTDCCPPTWLPSHACDTAPPPTWLPSRRLPAAARR